MVCKYSEETTPLKNMNLREPQIVLETVMMKRRGSFVRMSVGLSNIQLQVHNDLQFSRAV